MSNVRKYVTGGGINPHWLSEREREREIKIMQENISIVMDTIHNKELEYNCCDDYEEDDNDYEAKFQFLKKHSGSPEDLELAKIILGIYD